jgi:hypothetical protein
LTGFSVQRKIEQASDDSKRLTFIEHVLLNRSMYIVRECTSPAHHLLIMTAAV